MRLTSRSGGWLQLECLPAAGSSGALREGLEHVLTYVAQGYAHKVLLDQRGMGPLGEADALWLLLEWLPRATQYGPSYVAVLPAQEVERRLNMYTLHQQAKQRFPLVFHYFAQEQQAVDWLCTLA